MQKYLGLHGLAYYRSCLCGCCTAAGGHTLRGVSERRPAVRGVSERGPAVRGVSERGPAVRGVSERRPAVNQGPHQIQN